MIGVVCVGGGGGDNGHGRFGSIGGEMVVSHQYHTVDLFL